MSFSKLGLSPSLCLPLARLGYERPTPIQAQAIPAVLTGTDLLARAQTGTGKTAAFGLPMIERSVARRDGRRARLPHGLVLVPTRELAVQVHQSLATYGAPFIDARGRPDAIDAADRAHLTGSSQPCRHHAPLRHPPRSPTLSCLVLPR